ncbi:MAG TPA: DUF5667 domain-containing protein [Spirillospora sp.]|nr:DUF5667 domain-containing protein [Spirillospora sp.]
MSDSSYEIILDECLDAVLAGERTISDCLAQYPEHAAELKPALQMGLLVARLKKPELDAGQVDALEMRLRGQMLAAQRPAQSRTWAAALGKLAAMVALALLLTLGAGGGVVAASANSLPGDPLYGVKRLWETIVLALAALFNSGDDVWLHLARTRLDEAEDLARRGLLNRDILFDVYDATEQAMNLADAQTAPEVAAFLNEAEARLRSLPTTAATEPVRADLLALVIPGPDGRLRVPALQESPETDSAPPTASPTHTPTFEPTDTPAPTITASPSPTATSTASPTSRVPATATRTRSPTVTPTPTITPSATPTATWTPLPLPFMPTQTGGTSSSSGGGSSSRPTSTPVPPTVDVTATIRYRDTQAAVYATQTAQAAIETEEPAP